MHLFEIVTSKGLGGDLQENTAFDLDLGIIKVTQNIAYYALHNMTYAPAKFEVATSNS